MRFRPRFSVRTLAIFVTLVCVYFGAWELTKRYAIETRIAEDGIVLRHGDSMQASSSPIPFLIQTKCIEQKVVNNAVGDVQAVHLKYCKRYSLWLFGMQIYLPITAEWEPDENEMVETFGVGGFF